MMLEVLNLNSGYQRAHILFDFSLHAHAGEVVVLLGRNGAGKSTALKAIMGLLRIWSGEVRFRQKPIARLLPHQIARLGMAYIPEERRVFTELSVIDNLLVGQQPARSGLQAWTLERIFDNFPKLRELRNREAGTLSGGEQQMLTIARGLMGNPSMILLDEPSEGLAPLVVAQLVKIISALKQEGIGIVLSEQNLHFAKQVADRCYVIEQGQIRYSGNMHEFLQDDRLQQTYLAI